MNYKRIIVTGASGYLGSKLVMHLLQEGVEVACVIRATSDLTLLQPMISEIKFIEYDNNIKKMIEEFTQFRADVVIHFASCFLSSHKPEQIEALVNSNVLFGTHLLEAMLHSGTTRLINTATSWQYFEGRHYDPVCLYAATKEAFEKIITYYTKGCAFTCMTLQLYDTYGPNDPRKKLLWILKDAAATNIVLKMSPGEQLLNLVHVDDVVAAYIQALKLVSKQAVGTESKYAVCAEESYSIKQIVCLYERVTRQTLKIDWGGRPYRYREVMTPANNLQKVPGWTSKISLIEGLKGL